MSAVCEIVKTIAKKSRENDTLLNAMNNEKTISGWIFGLIDKVENTEDQSIRNLINNDKLTFDRLNSMSGSSVDAKLIADKINLLSSIAGKTSKSDKAELLSILLSDSQTKAQEIAKAISQNDEFQERIQFVVLKDPDQRYANLNIDKITSDATRSILKIKSISEEVDNYEAIALASEEAASHLIKMFGEGAVKKFAAKKAKLAGRFAEINKMFEHRQDRESNKIRTEMLISASEKATGASIVKGLIGLQSSGLAINLNPNFIVNANQFTLKQSIDKEGSSKEDAPLLKSSPTEFKFDSESNTLDIAFGTDKVEMNILGQLFGTTKNENGISVVTIPNDVMNVVKTASIIKAGGMFESLQYSPFSDDFQSIWGIDINGIDEASLEKVLTAYQSGKVPQAGFISSLGREIYKNSSVKFAKNVDSDLELQAQTAFGLLALQYLNWTGLISYDKDVMTYKDGKGDTKNQAVFSINLAGRNPDFSPTVHGGQRETLIRDARKNLENLASGLEYLGFVEQRSFPSSEPILDQPKTIRNSFIEKPESVQKEIESKQSKALKFTSGLEPLYIAYKKDPMMAYRLMGAYSVDTSRNIADQRAEAFKINYARMQIDSLMDAYEEFGTEPFYLPYDYTVSGRYMINSIVNPQESKITRFLVTSDSADGITGMETTIDLETMSGLEEIELAIAQAFGIGVDKQTDSKSFADLAKIVVLSDNPVQPVSFVDPDSIFAKAYKVVQKILEDPDLLAIEDALDLEKAMLKGEHFHVYQALVALTQFENAVKESAKSGEKRFTLELTMESDAITSGAGITLGNISTDSAKELAIKAGVYDKEFYKTVLEGYLSIPEELRFSGKLPIVPKSKDGDDQLTHGFLLEASDLLRKELKENPESELSKKVNELVSSSKHFANFVNFRDVYNTVANTANERMALLKDRMNEDGKLFNPFMKPLEEIDPSDVLSAKAIVSLMSNIKRNDAKPPVMVYLYGAMMSSIRRKLLADVVEPQVYKVLSIPMFNDGTDIRSKVAELISSGKGSDSRQKFQVQVESILGSTGIDADSVIFVLSKVLFTPEGRAPSYSAVRYSEATNSIVRLEENRAIQGKNIELAPSALNFMKRASDATIGNAFESGFREFGDIDKYRLLVKGMETVRFTIFKHKLKEKLSVMQKAYSSGSKEFKLSTKDLANAVNEIEKDGFGHSVNDINGGRQPLYKKEALEKDLRVFLSTFNGKQLGKSSSSESKDFILNTGASGVITVHSLDGFIDTVSSGAFNLVRIYDGSVSGSDALLDSIESYNEVFMEALAFNPLITQMTDMHKRLKKISSDGSPSIKEMFESLSNTDKQSMLDAFGVLMGLADESGLAGFAADINTRNSIFRPDNTKLFVDSMLKGRSDANYFVGHSYLSDKAKINDFAIDTEPHDSKLPSDSIEVVFNAVRELIQLTAQYELSLQEGTENIVESETDRAVVLNGKQSQYLAKDQAKSNLANKFIGIGEEGSSTANYAKSWGELANQESYSKDDVVFVSVNGNSKNRAPVVIGKGEQGSRLLSLLNSAFHAGSTIVADNEFNRKRDYNTGERDLAKLLLENGYVEGKMENGEGSGIWSKTSDTSGGINSQFSGSIIKATNTKNGSVLTGLDGKANIHISSLKNLSAFTLEYTKALESIGKSFNGNKSYIDYFNKMFDQLESSGLKFPSNGITIKLMPSASKDNLGYARSDKDNHSIELSFGKEFSEAIYPSKVVLHEYAHIVTQQAIDSNPILKNRIKSLMDYALKANPDLKKEYGFKDGLETEFIAEAISSPRLQYKLSKIKIESTTILDRVQKLFSYIVNRISGSDKQKINNSISESTVLKEAISLVQDIANQLDSESAPFDFASKVDVSNELASKLGIDQKLLDDCRDGIAKCK